MSENRIAINFQKIKEEGKTALIPYTMSANPNFEKSLEILNLLAKYSDIIEFGIPSSDPIFDGSEIQASGKIALENNFNIDNLLTLIKKFRETNQSTAIIFMSYHNPIYAYGFEKLTQKMNEIGVDGLIIPDLPIEEQVATFKLCTKFNIALIQLICLNSVEKRIEQIVENASGFIYLVGSTKGVTGGSLSMVELISQQVLLIESKTNIPICLGFGVKTPDDADKLNHVVGGVIIGTIICEIVNKLSLTSNQTTDTQAKIMQELEDLMLAFYKKLN